MPVKNKIKSERSIKRNEKRLDELIQKNKFLRNQKYYKNNYWSWAAWDSWAAQGKAGSCGCGCGYYNGTLANKRAKTERGGHENFCKYVSPHLCYDCAKYIENKIGTEFKRR